jgi:transposase
MDVLCARCCGLDVHKKLLVACVIITPSEGEPERIVHSFGTMTEELLKLGDWLESCGG